MSETAPQPHAAVPMRSVGPARITGPVMDGEVMLPLATYESPLWPSVQRGAKISRLAGGIRAVVVDERMTRSVLLEAPGAEEAVRVVAALQERRADLAAAAEASSRFARFLDFHTQIVGNLLYLRLEMQTGDAAGHNMVTAAADRLIAWLLEQYPELKYVSVSGNYCTDKKPSAVNGILGRGRSVIAEAVIARAICEKHLKTTPEKVADLNLKKNLLGTCIAGGLRSANAHFANMLLGFYLATGQDAANIVEGSQGFTTAEARADGLYFAVTVPHLIVGTVGSGKDLDFVRANLEALGCLAQREPGQNARRLAVIAAAAVWCGELSLLAAQTNPGELMRAHEKFERRK
ncbi:MAG: hydroxymethylglutaryl-CoA reductase [Kiritimatiellae bacterium]|nr:hydroxymethylglutaryl-CoA reductase [Kiritimatiellia bacterium]